MSRLSLYVSIVALFVASTVALLMLSRDYEWAGDTVYELSRWSGNGDTGMTLNLYGFVPIGYCFLAYRDVEAEKICVIGPSRYQRFYRPPEKSGG